MSDLDLAALVRAVINETDLTDPYDIGQKVAEQVPSKQLRPALAVAVSYMARTQFGRDRGRALAPVASAANPTRSAKVAAFRENAEAWRKALHIRIHIGDGNRLLLADCSYDHLMFAAGERRQHAAQNIAAAEVYESLADQLRRLKVTRVADLPDAVLRPALVEGRLAA